MTDPVKTVSDLDTAATARLLLDMIHRQVVHYGLWFNEVRHQMGLETATKILGSAAERSRDIQLKRLSRQLGFEVQDGIPAALLKMPKETLLELMDAIAVNWLANDGVWFQAVEFAHGMNDAKRCNDSCWAQFSPVEAWSIKRLLEMPDKPGLDGLKTALNFRLYARINTQSFVDEGPEGFTFQMNKCRVQSARKRKGLEDYPCKSGGLVEYTYFARTIDARIRTICVACPPDEHPDEWYCAWRFSLAEPAGPVRSVQVR
jgi:hypothetical protein